MSDNLQNFIEAVLFCVFMVVFMWLYCLCTPSQMSGEYDLAVAEGERILAADSATTSNNIQQQFGN